MTSLSRQFPAAILSFVILAAPAWAETLVRAGEYALGPNCSVHVERKKGEVYEFFVEQKAPPMYTKVALDLGKRKVISGPNLCGYRNHPKATIETRSNGHRTAYFLDCGGTLDAVQGETKLILNVESGKLEFVSTKFAVSRIAVGTAHLGPFKKTTEDFLCVSYGDESMAALEAVERLHAMTEDRRNTEAARVSDRRVSGKSPGAVESGPARRPAGWYSSPAQ